MLEVKNLTFNVHENGVERSIVENISFQVQDGEMLVITGPNGGGKSTLAKVLMGIEKPTADRSFWMEKILPVMTSITGQAQGSASRFSSRQDLKE